MQKISQEFNDGVLSVYRASDDNSTGDMPQSTLTKIHEAIRYEERTVSANRFWSGLQNDITLAKTLRIPNIGNVRANDIVVDVNKTQFYVKQSQLVKTVYPPCLDLSLQEVEVSFEI